MYKYKPLNNYILIKPLKEKSDSAIDVPDSVGGSQKKGKVIAINPEEEHIKVGDVVLYHEEVTKIKDYIVVEKEAIYVIEK